MSNSVEARRDYAAVGAFSRAMMDKLDKKRAEGRRGWWKPGECSIEDLLIMLSDQIRKGDMVDIGNFAMMIWNRQQDKKRAEELLEWK